MRGSKQGTDHIGLNELKSSVQWENRPMSQSFEFGMNSEREKLCVRNLGCLEQGCLFSFLLPTWLSITQFPGTEGSPQPDRGSIGFDLADIYLVEFLVDAG